ncbi:hypothetical protein L211DRAFT_853040 [Terfezia boudieri ATCC MYA-4762]|uniref:Uncharacterized protein n=1 Tax=Terfezia boudieri ATCC MYA-4762 TaxID=1051890 RepID=A0A3N4L9I2_9PEZI|nr:hypothetical protein L211DRAFT_853040 [Terfezia boudieri ATCC MYA-4762]
MIFNKTSTSGSISDLVPQGYSLYVPRAPRTALCVQKRHPSKQHSTLLWTAWTAWSGLGRLDRMDWTDWIDWIDWTDFMPSPQDCPPGPVGNTDVACHRPIYEQLYLSSNDIPDTAEKPPHSYDGCIWDYIANTKLILIGPLNDFQENLTATVIGANGD